jgi:hypothetical protein
VDLVAQKACYDAFFETAWTRPWLAGVYWWKWYPGMSGSGNNTDFTPQKKSAQKVMFDYFQRAREPIVDEP